MRFNRSGLHCWGFFVSALALGLPAGCAGQSTLTPLPANLGSTDTLARLGADVPDVSPPPKCAGQKTTQYYAEVAKEVLKANGGSLCVPAFEGWGGALQYPRTYGSYTYTVKLVSSIKAYKGAMLPPGGSKKPIFYLQIGFNSFPGLLPNASQRSAAREFAPHAQEELHGRVVRVFLRARLVRRSFVLPGRPAVKKRRIACRRRRSS